MTKPVCLWTEVYIPHYRGYIEWCIMEQKRIIREDAEATAKYAEEYKKFSWWKRLWNSKPGERDHSDLVRGYTRQHISELKQTISRLDYEENEVVRTHTKVLHTSGFFQWEKDRK